MPEANWTLAGEAMMRAVVAGRGGGGGEDEIAGVDAS